MSRSDGAASAVAHTETGKNTSNAKTTSLPGINTPLNDKETRSLLKMTYSNWREYALPLTVRERMMLGIMAALKDKPDWERKVFDHDIVNKWSFEALDASKSMIRAERAAAVASLPEEKKKLAKTEAKTRRALDIERFNAPARQRVITKRVFQCCIDELRAQALLSKANEFTEVMDANAAVYFSDTIISDDIKEALKAGVAPLENVREDQKDWHPGSQGKVLDLVHPSLFPLMYGKSRYLSRSKVPLKGCAEHTGSGKRVQAIPEPGKEDHSLRYYSLKHQWLPSDLRIKTNDEAKIKSYINNLLPEGNEGLYHTIEKVIAKCIPFWKATLRSTCFRTKTPRIVLQGDGYIYDNPPQWMANFKAQEEEVDTDDDDGNYFSSEKQERYQDDNQQYTGYSVRVPRPDAYHPRERSSTDERASEFDRSFPKRDLQVIVKLANIHLTPEKSTYEGGSWHVEGLKNEHICARALYYYDSSNITDSYLAFREEVNGAFLAFNSIYRDDNYDWPVGPDYDQDGYDGIAEIYGLCDYAGNMPENQVLGQVLTRENRLLTFPNVLQHRVSPFALADPTKLGHRKLLALFLVDPDIRIPSTANIPPQQLSWWADRINQKTERTHFSKLPNELMDKIYSEVSGFPLGLAQAKRVRRSLMKERRAEEQATNKKWRQHDYMFCEH